MAGVTGLIVSEHGWLVLSAALYRQVPAVVSACANANASN